MVQKIEIRMRNVGAVVVGNIVAIIQESVRKVATLATHGGEKDRCTCNQTSIQLCDIARGL